MTLSELIEALENSTGPDRWLDAKIDAALRIGSEKMQREREGFGWAWKNFPVWAHHKQARGMCGVLHANGDLGLIWDSVAFTASLDAALTLTAGAEIEMTNLYGVARVTIYGQGGGYSPFYGSHECNSLPIALCIASLKALQARGDA